MKQQFFIILKKINSSLEKFNKCYYYAGEHLWSPAWFAI